MQSLTRKQDEEIRLAGHALPSQFELVESNGTRNNVFLTYGAAAAVENPRLKNQDVNDAMRRFQKRPVAHGPTAHVEAPSPATGDRDLAAVKGVDAYDPNTTSTHMPTSLNAVVARGTRSATRAKIHELGRGTMLAVGALGARSGEKRSYSDLNPPPLQTGSRLKTVTLRIVLLPEPLRPLARRPWPSRTPQILSLAKVVISSARRPARDPRPKRSKHCAQSLAGNRRQR